MSSDVKIVSITMVRNEADIIELFVRHHLEFVDRMIIIDHLSIDATPDILRSLADEGAPITITRETNPAYTQGKYLTRVMKRAAQDYHADWIIPLDADEFLVTEDGDARAAIEALSPDQPYKIPWRTYAPRAEDALDEPLLFERIPWRRSIEPEPIYKVLIPRGIAERQEARLSIGSHDIRDRMGGKHQNLAAEELDQLHLAHFPARSCNQLTLKALILSLGFMAQAKKRSQAGRHYHKMFERICDRGVLSPEELAAYGRQYALSDETRDTSIELIHDPLVSVVRASDLRHATESELNPLAVLAQTAESLARTVAEERNKGFFERLFSKRS